MKLGKRFANIKKRYNASNIKISFTSNKNEKIPLPRKLEMMAVLMVMGIRVNKKALARELEKYQQK